MIAFRTDASFDIGSGHLMRCLTLADELFNRGHECVFAIRSQPGDHSQLVLERGHELLLLPRVIDEDADHSGSELAHARWLMGGMDRDAFDFIEALQGRKPEWVVVDHYGIDRRWEACVRAFCSRVLVIDDLADREHFCDVLLDQNLGRTPNSYAGLVPESSTMLCGPEFALLRPEFRQWRDYSIRQKRKVSGHRLLINLGGVDRDNITGRVLDALLWCPEADLFDVTVVMGSNAPCLEVVKKQVRELNLKIKLLTGISNMAEVMANSDLAIGAAGATSWERCCLGLPTLLLVIAENQQAGAAALSENGVALGIFDMDRVSSQLCEKLATLSDQRDVFMSASTALCDGAGALRVANCLQESSLG